jgi:hypothetical protein
MVSSVLIEGGLTSDDCEMHTFGAVLVSCVLIEWGLTSDGNNVTVVGILMVVNGGKVGGAPSAAGTFCCFNLASPAIFSFA